MKMHEIEKIKDARKIATSHDLLVNPRTNEMTCKNCKVVGKDNLAKELCK